MKSLLSLLLLASAFLLAQEPTPQPIPILVLNPSFEQGTSGWQWSGSRPFEPAHFASPTPNFPFPPPPDGSTVALAGYGSFFFQDIAIPARPSGIYALKFSVANYFYWYPGQYVASVSLDSFYQKPLCSVSGHALGDFTEITLLCPVRDQVATNLRMQFQANGWSSLFDKVSLEFTAVNP